MVGCLLVLVVPVLVAFYTCVGESDSDPSAMFDPIAPQGPRHISGFEDPRSFFGESWVPNWILQWWQYKPPTASHDRLTYLPVDPPSARLGSGRESNRRVRSALGGTAACKHTDLGGFLGAFSGTADIHFGSRAGSSLAADENSQPHTGILADLGRRA